MEAPKHLFLAGCLVAFYIVSITYAVRALAWGTQSFVLFGQLFMLVIDHFGLFNAPERGSARCRPAVVMGIGLWLTQIATSKSTCAVSATPTGHGQTGSRRCGTNLDRHQTFGHQHHAVIFDATRPSRIDRHRVRQRTRCVSIASLAVFRQRPAHLFGGCVMVSATRMPGYCAIVSSRAPPPHANTSAFCARRSGFHVSCVVAMHKNMACIFHPKGIGRLVFAMIDLNGNDAQPASS